MISALAGIGGAMSGIAKMPAVASKIGSIARPQTPSAATRGIAPPPPNGGVQAPSGWDGYVVPISGPGHYAPGYGPSASGGSAGDGMAHPDVMPQTPEQRAANLAQPVVGGAPAVGGVAPPPGSSPGGTFGSMAQPFGQHMADPTIDPGYAWREGRGQLGLERAAAANGTLMTGATMADLMDYNQGLASQEYGNAWNRAYQSWMGEHGIFDSNRNFQARTLSDMSGQGLGAASSYLNTAGEAAYGSANSQAAAQAARGRGWADTAQTIGDFGSAAWMWGNRPRTPQAPPVDAPGMT